MTEKNTTGMAGTPEERPDRRIKKEEIEMLVGVIAEAMLEKKASDVTRIDVGDLTSLTDVFLISHAGSDVQVKAIADNVEDKTRKILGEKPWKSEGWDNRRWIVLDYVDVVVNIFTEDAREYYALEKMWGDGKKTTIAD
jgi:ribosome-associated protein